MLFVVVIVFAGCLDLDVRHPGCPCNSRKNRHPDAYIHVNMGIQMPIFTLNMGIPLSWLDHSQLKLRHIITTFCVVSFPAVVKSGRIRT